MDGQHPATPTLGFDKPPAATRVVVAMSGGVDSSTVAALLVEGGYDVVGITLQLYDHGAAVGRKGACCAGQDIHDARAVADALGIPHYVLDFERRFAEAVMKDFADTYVSGRTPIPCVRCNQTVKFRDLAAIAGDLGADAMATGHYVRWHRGVEGPELHRAADASRDQSYFLFATTRAQLRFLRFPLGMLNKDETRSLARRFALPVAAKPDSQDICFVPDGDYARVVEKLRPQAFLPGDIVGLDGAVLGRHDGIAHFTVGQRRGLGIAEGVPLFVLAIDPDTNRVIVGPREALYRDLLSVGEVNWLGEGRVAPADALPVEVKIRSAQPLVAATVRGLADGRAEVRLATPQAGIAPGQACVFYAAERVLGGGWIERPS